MWPGWATYSQENSLAALCCPRCGLEYALPVEPLFTVASSALMLGMTIGSLQRWLTRHRQDYGIDPPRYMGSWGARRRMLNPNEIKYIRSLTVSPHRSHKAMLLVAARAAQEPTA